MILFLSEKKLSAALISIFILLNLFVSFHTLAQKDLPGPPSSFQAIPAGSFIIPMDTTYQSIVPAGQAPFNLKAYGLINQFLQNGIPVKWAIRAGKQREGIDLTAFAQRYAPGFIPAAQMDFRGGPFIVPDTILPCGLSTREIIRTFGNNVAVYLLTAGTTADIRYTLVHRPKIAVFNNGGNQLIHTRILNAAGITNYDVMDAANLNDLINCYTFVSEPHADTSEITMTVINAVRSFVMNGGNFLAQCHAVNSYENRAFFQTTAGITVVNTTVSHVYPNADLAYSQIDGTLQQNEGGSIHNWTLNNGSSWRPYTYLSVANIGTDTVVATGAHLIAPSEPGGNVFYLGGHDYSKGKGNITDLSTLPRLNGLRFYLNAVFVPSKHSNGAWANAGTGGNIACSDSIILGCNPTGPPHSTFSWTPAAGLSCTDCPNPVARPSVSTVYQVTVTNGCVAKDTVTVVVGPRPVAGYNNTVVCQGLATTFTDQSSAANFWRWNFGDAGSGTANYSDLQNPTHIFTKAGTFTVTLIAGTAFCTDTIAKSVTVLPLPVLTVPSPEICSGQTATLTATGASSYLWSTGDAGSTITATPAATTSYTVKGTNTSGCSSNAVAVVNVIPPLVPVIAGNPVHCFGSHDGKATVQVSGGKPGYTYSWNTLPVQTTATAQGLSKGTYSVTVTDAGGCTVQAAVTITEPSVLTAQTSATDVKCHDGNDGTATVYSSGGTTPYSYSWNSVPVQTTAVATGLKKGTYVVTVTDAQGCAVSPAATIAEPSAVTVTTSVTEVNCNGGNDGSAAVSVNGNYPPYSFSWNTVPAQSSPKATGLSKGNYVATVTDATGCMTEVPVTVPEPPPMIVNLGADRAICTESDEVITLQAGPGVKYFWYPTGDTTSFLVVRNPGVYSVTVTNARGCPASDEIYICGTCDPRIFVSNAFSPNKDGLNELYNVYGKYETDFHMLIFNRWGEIIFESMDKNACWDGYYRGEPMPIGVYPWIITYKGSCGDNKVRKMEGSVTVVR